MRDSLLFTGLLRDLIGITPVHSIAFAADREIRHHRQTFAVSRIQCVLLRWRTHRVASTLPQDVETIPADCPLDVERFAVLRQLPTRVALHDLPMGRPIGKS